MSCEEKATKKSWILDILESSFESGDVSIFFNNLDEDGLDQDDFREYIHKSLDDLPQKEDNILNALQTLMTLIQSHGVKDDQLAAHLAKTVLLTITEEACCIMNIKRAIHIFNILIQNSEVLHAVMDDASIEGSLQILGRRVPACGDYECQALMFEAMYRVTSNGNCEYWANIWFSDTVAKNMFLSLDPQKFESNCRRVLNYINRNEPNKRVFSFIASSVSFGSYQLSEPCGSELWVDFNYDSQSISFYSSEINFDESANNSEMWETILISDSSVKSYTVIERKSEKLNEIVLLLNSPCHTLITSSNISNPAFNSYKVSIVVWDILDIYEQLEMVYGKDKYMHEKLTSPGVTEAEEEVPIALSKEVLSPLRKVSNLSDPIPVHAFKSEDIIPGTDQNLVVAVYRKISKTIETIPISSEILSEDIQKQNLKKISASSEVIEIETSEVIEGMHKKRKSSVSVDTISCDLNNDILQKSSDKLQEEPEVKTCSRRKVSYSACLKVEKEENYIPIQKRKKKMRKIRKKQLLKNSPSSSGSLKIINDSSGLKKHEGSISKENEIPPNNYNKPTIRKSSTFTSKMKNSLSDELKNNVHDVIEDTLVVNTFDICKSDQEPKIGNEITKESKISSNSPSFIAETLNEKTISFNKNFQSDHKSTSKNYTSPLVPGDTVSSIKKLEKVEDANNKNQEKEKESSISSKETDNSEMTSKGNNRRVRLYNLESAPVYDVPPLLSNSDPITQDLTSSKPISDICQRNNTSNFGQGANSSDRQKNESVAQKAYAKRKRSSTYDEHTVMKTVKDKKIKLFTDPSESEDDFQNAAKRKSYKRRGGKCFTPSVAANRQNYKRKRKLEEYNSGDSGSIKRKPAKIPRTAAVRARRKTKEILDSSFAIACDKIEVMNESTVDSETTSMQNRSKVNSKKSSKNNTDTETQSSEVSWIKQKRSFEFPKRTYAHWSARKKILQEKKKLEARADIDNSCLMTKQIISGSKPLLEEPPCEKEKEVTTVGSETKSKSCGLSDSENCDFIIERKDTQRHRVLSALASDFQSLSASVPSRNSVKKRFHSYSCTSLCDIDSDFNDKSKQQSETAAEIVANNEHITSDLTKISHITNSKHSTSSNFEILSGEERNPNKDCNQSNISNDDARGEDIVHNQNCSNVDEQNTPVIDHDKLSEEENDEERENVSSKHSLEDTNATNGVLDEKEKKKLKKYIQETKGKRFILQRFLKSVKEYSGTQSDDITSEPQTEINLSLLQDKTSLLSAKCSKNSVFHDSGSNISTLHPPSEKKIPKNQNNKIKNKANETSEYETKVKKPKIFSVSEKLDKRDNSAINNQLVKRVNLQHSRVYASSINDPTTFRNVENQKPLGKAMSERIVPISKDYDGSERCFKKHEHFKELKGFGDHSFNSLHSKLASPSVVFSEKDKTWFDTITLALFQDANILSRKLLATVQKCFSEFITKMNTLRENIINTSNEFEISPSQNISNNELKHLVKNCKIIRLEVEKSLRRMHEVGKQYFEAEERHFRKLKRKHIKASRKFISKMRGVQQNSIKKLEGKVLLQTKFHLKKILKHIKSV